VPPSYSQAMRSSRVLRAVQRADGSYRITFDPPVAGIDALRAYTAAEVEQLAADLGAELRWVTPPEATRSAELWEGTLPPADDEPEVTPSAELWVGTLAPADDEE
jgi:hypothetical protein